VPPLEPESADLSLRLDLQMEFAPNERPRTLAHLTLAVPWERAPRARIARRTPRLTLAEKPTREEPPEGASSPEPSRPRVIVSELRFELVRATLHAALRAARVSDVRRRLASLRSRSRASSALPELRLRGGQSQDESLRLTPTRTDPDRFTRAGGAEGFWDAQLTWKLSRLLFADEELRVEQLEAQAAEKRATLLREVLGWLIRWDRARLTRSFAASEEAALKAALDQLEAEIRLDALTDGWFRRTVGSVSVRAG
jgi:hypothetical protein